jgi:hypothetical protein
VHAPGVSLTEEDVEFLEEDAATYGLSSRSAVLQWAIRIGALPPATMSELEFALRLHLSL